MSGYIALLLWSFLPGQVTNAILPTLMGMFPRLLPPSQPGSPGYQRNYRHVITALVLGWLVWAFVYEQRSSDARDAYRLLGVGYTAADDELRRAFRHLSRTYHPDRLGPHPPPEAEAKFIVIRQAYEVLTDPVKRFAYDRFGPNMLAWTKLESTRDYVQAGAQNAATFYAMSIAVMLLLALLGRARAGAYWRNILLGLAVVLEATLVLTPTPALDAPSFFAPILAVFPRPLARLLAPFVPGFILRRPAYMHIALVRRVFADASVAISQLTGVWSEPENETMRALHSLAAGINAESLKDLAEEVGPVLGGTTDVTAAERNLLQRMDQILLDRALAGHPLIAPAYNAALRETAHVPAQVHMDSTGQGHIHPIVSGASASDANATSGAQIEPSRDGDLSIAASLPLPLSRAPSPANGSTAEAVPSRSKRQASVTASPSARRRSARLTGA